MEEINRGHTTQLLWTGGWDSTFRLLELVLVKQKPVQTYYLIDLNRRSTQNELRALRIIKDAIIKNYPHAKRLILPTHISEIGDLQLEQAIIEAHKAILSQNKIGQQNTWLSQFCKDNKFSDIELCVGVMRNSGLSLILEPYLEEVGVGCEKIYRIKKDYYETPVGIIFRYYTFPLFNREKCEMQKTSENHGWMPIMKLTWFCHTPVFGVCPCGICVPCTDAFNEKMSWRFPGYLKLLNKLKILDILRKFRIYYLKIKHYNKR